MREPFSHIGHPKFNPLAWDVAMIIKNICLTFSYFDRCLQRLMITLVQVVALCRQATSHAPIWTKHLGPLVFSLICAWTNGCANNRDASDLRHHRAYCDVTVMKSYTLCSEKDVKSILFERILFGNFRTFWLQGTVFLSPIPHMGCCYHPRYQNNV